MAKSPRRGAVKRRLGRDVGDGAALRFYRACLSHSLMRLGRDPRWVTQLVVAPDRDGVSPIFPPRPRIKRMAQGHGDLGRRMQRLFDRLPPGPVIIVGSDIPAMRPSHIAHAFRLLGSADTVLGPARDGGYWLIGLRRSPRILSPFAGVRWSTGNAFADTLANLDGSRISFVATLSDVDTEQDLRRAGGASERLI
jgi:uncharacterized protein